MLSLDQSLLPELNLTTPMNTVRQESYLTWQEDWSLIGNYFRKEKDMACREMVAKSKGLIYPLYSVTQGKIKK